MTQMTEMEVRLLYPRLEEFVAKRRRKMGKPIAWAVVASVKEANEFTRMYLPCHFLA